MKPRDFTTPSRRLKLEDIEKYWEEWKEMFPVDKDRFWDGLLTGLNNYLNILQGLFHYIFLKITSFSLIILREN